jgi:hypothetical protein
VQLRRRSRTVLLGTAKPIPMFPSLRALVMIAVFIPMTSPRTFSSGPPELPGLIAASVWACRSSGRW